MTRATTRPRPPGAGILLGLILGGAVWLLIGIVAYGIASWWLV